MNPIRPILHLPKPRPQPKPQPVPSPGIIAAQAALSYSMAYGHTRCAAHAVGVYPA